MFPQEQQKVTWGELVPVYHQRTCASEQSVWVVCKYGVNGATDLKVSFTEFEFLSVISLVKGCICMCHLFTEGPVPVINVDTPLLIN